MVKIIEKMPASVADRFRELYVLSDERSKINDLFEQVTRLNTQRFEDQKLPLLKLRDEILNGTNVDFDEHCAEFD